MLLREVDGALTMTITHRNLPHGQWPTNLAMATDVDMTPWNFLRVNGKMDMGQFRSQISGRPYHLDHKNFGL